MLDCESKGPAFNSNKMHCGGFFETIIVELSRYLFHPGVQGTSKLSGGGGGGKTFAIKIFFEIKDHILKIIFKRYRNKGEDLTRFLFILRECRTYKVSY